MGLFRPDSVPPNQLRKNNSHFFVADATALTSCENKIYFADKAAKK
jgi:hypothetical protein